jgi:hypothetical protein
VENYNAVDSVIGFDYVGVFAVRVGELDGWGEVLRRCVFGGDGDNAMARENGCPGGVCFGSVG